MSVYIYIYIYIQTYYFTHGYFGLDSASTLQSPTGTICAMEALDLKVGAIKDFRILHGEDNGA